MYCGPVRLSSETEPNRQSPFLISEEGVESETCKEWQENRRFFIGGSDAQIIVGNDAAALLRLWREKRGEVEPEDLSSNLIVQLGVATEELNRRCLEAKTGQSITDVQRQLRHPTLRWMGATLDGRMEATGAVFEAKFMLPWSFSEEGAAGKSPRSKRPGVLRKAMCHLRATAVVARSPYSGYSNGVDLVSFSLRI
jgi:YqaJ-like viral recombinase domain